MLRPSWLLIPLTATGLLAQLPSDPDHIASALQQAEKILSTAQGRTSGDGLKLLRSLVFDCDGVEVTPVPCGEAWDWYGAELQTDDKPETIRPLEVYYRKAMERNQSGFASAPVLALSLELEAMALHFLGDRATASELTARAVVLRQRSVGLMGDSEPSAEPALRVSPGRVSAPRVAYKVDPAYSEIARLLKYSGSVTFSVVVGVDGKARDLRLVKGLGFGLDEEAAKAILQWEFVPGMKDDAPVNIRATIEVNFRLL
jgi:TonB family protein